MRIVVIDGQGGGIGRALMEGLRAALPRAELIAAGTNALATAAMLKAGASAGSTGENAVVYNCAHADIIVGAMGIVLASSMLGEITPKMASACAECGAQLVLVPVTKCRSHIAGLPEKPLSQYIEDAVRTVVRLAE